MTVNKAILIGVLGRDPERRVTTGGTPVVNLRIATDDRRRDRDGNWTKHTEWHNVVVFGRQADNVARYLSKGRQVYVEGRIQTRTWQDRDGRDRWSTEIVADRVQFLGSGRGGGVGGGAGGEDIGGRDIGGGGYGSEPGPESPMDPDDAMDDIPF